MKKPFSLLDADNVKKIQAAAQRGAKKITLGGRVFLIKRQVILASYDVTTTPAVNQADKVVKRVKRKETWLAVRPERGGLPCASIEVKRMKNLRSATVEAAS